MNRRLWVLLGAMITGAALSPASAFGGTLDQAQTNGASLQPSTYTCIQPGLCYSSSFGQTFTAGLSGVVDEVDLKLDRGGSTTTPLTVEIRTTVSGCPSATVLASVQVPATDIPVSASGPVPPFHAVAFPSPANVVAGTRYAIVIYTTAGPNYYFLYGSDSGQYSAGQICSSGSPPDTWSAGGSGEDLAFKDFVAPSPPTFPQPTPSTTSPAGATGERAAALVRCYKRALKHHWPHKRLTKCKRSANLLPP
jgi:hypothetical protein